MVTEVPASATLSDLKSFFRSKVSADIPTFDIRLRSNNAKTQSVDIVFASCGDVRKSFISGDLQESMTIFGTTVRLRPRLGKNTAAIQWYLEIFMYIDREFRTRYWIQLALIMICVFNLLQLVIPPCFAAVEGLFKILGVFGTIVKTFMHLVILVVLFVFFGFHTYMDIRDANQSLKQEEQKNIENARLGRTSSYLGLSPDAKDKQG